MQERTPTTAFQRLNRYLTTPLLPPWLNGLFVAGMAVGVAVLLWDRRGPVTAVLALAFYGTGAAFVLRGPEWLATWTRAHPVVDSLILIPLLLFCLLFVTHLPAWVCVATSLAVGLLFAALTARLRRTRTSEQSD